MQFDEFYFKTLYGLYCHTPIVTKNQRSKYVYDAFNKPEITNSGDAKYNAFLEFAKSSYLKINKKRKIDWYNCLLDFLEKEEFKRKINEEGSYRFDSVIKTLFQCLSDKWTLCLIDTNIPNSLHNKIGTINGALILNENDLFSCTSYAGYQQSDLTIKLLVKNLDSTKQVTSLLRKIDLDYKLNRVGKDLDHFVFKLTIYQPHMLKIMSDHVIKANNEITSVLDSKGKYSLYCENKILGYVASIKEMKEFMNEDLDTAIRNISTSGFQFNLTTFHSYHWQNGKNERVLLGKLVSKRFVTLIQEKVQNLLAA